MKLHVKSLYALIFAVHVGVFFCCPARGGGTYLGVDLYTLNPPAGLTYPSAGQNVGGNDSTYLGQIGGFATETEGKLSYDQAVLWSPTGMATNLNPTNLAGFSSSVINGVSGSQEVGSGTGIATGATLSSDPNHALLWNGTASSAVDLQPINLPAIVTSGAFATDGTNQVGYGVISDGIDHAMVWTGTAASAVDLQPAAFPGYVGSVAYGVSGNQQVGELRYKMPVANNEYKPVLWSGTAASAIDLTPTDLSTVFNSGYAALGIGGGQEVGFGFGTAGSTGISHAIVWSGTAASAVDLNPAGSTDSVAVATNGTFQVGYVGVTIGDAPEPTNDAVVWQGTSESAVDLQNFLPSYLGDSAAYSVDAAGDVFGIALDNLGNYHAVEWIPTAVPEPMGLTLAALGMLLLLRRRGRLHLECPSP